MTVKESLKRLFGNSFAPTSEFEAKFSEILAQARGEGAAAAQKPLLDPITGNIFADWLEDEGEATAAAKLREAFPYDPALSEMLVLRTMRDQLLVIFATDEDSRGRLRRRLNDPASLDAKAFLNGHWESK